MRETGQSVAVKVQRPSVRESIALDVYIMRYLVGRFGILRKLNSDLPSLLDEWAGSLFSELDYRREAQNGTKFQELYSHLEVSLSCYAPVKTILAPAYLQNCFPIDPGQPRKLPVSETAD